MEYKDLSLMKSFMKNLDTFEENIHQDLTKIPLDLITLTKQLKTKFLKIFEPCLCSNPSPSNGEVGLQIQKVNKHTQTRLVRELMNQDFLIKI